MPRVNSDSSKVESLVKILRREQATGFGDAAVIGGLDSFLQQAEEELVPVLGPIKSYAALSHEQRETWTAAALLRLEKAAAPRKGARATGRRTSPTRSRQRTPPLSLGDEVTRVRGVGSRNLSKLKKLGVERVRDLVYLFPHRHSDYTEIVKVAELQPGKDRTVVATVWESSERNTGPRRKASEAVLATRPGMCVPSGSTIPTRHGPYGPERACRSAAR